MWLYKVGSLVGERSYSCLLPMFRFIMLSASKTRTVQQNRAAAFPVRGCVEEEGLYCCRVFMWCDKFWLCHNNMILWSKESLTLHRVELPPCLWNQRVAVFQQPACLFIQQPDWPLNGGWLPSAIHPPIPQLELATIQLTSSTLEEGISCFTVVQYNRDQFWLKPC